MVEEGTLHKICFAFSFLIDLEYYIKVKASIAMDTSLEQETSETATNL